MADRTARFNNWFQIISNIAIVVGLALVIYELNQSKQLAHAQIADSSITQRISISIALMGEDPREAIAKAELRPDELGESDAVTLDALYRTVTLGWFNLLRSIEIADLDRNPEAIVRAEARQYFTSEPGRRWLAAWADRRRHSPFHNRIVEIADAAVKDESGESIGASLEALLKNE